jgi:hypothetical protein
MCGYLFLLQKPLHNRGDLGIAAGLKREIVLLTACVPASPPLFRFPKFDRKYEITEIRKKCGEFFLKAALHRRHREATANNLCSPNENHCED